MIAAERRAAFARPAQADLREAVSWIARDNAEVALAFRAAILQAARLILEHPEAGPLRPDLTSLPFRILVLRGWPYVIIYNPRRTPPRILRVLHGARDLPDLLAGLRD